MIFIRYNRELESPLLNKPYVLCGPIVHPARMSSPILRSENGLDLFFPLLLRLRESLLCISLVPQYFLYVKQYINPI